MDIKTIKNIPISVVMVKLGLCIIRTCNSDLWYKSPFRNEKTASFKVDINKNIWYDFGEGIGGNIFDFVMRLKDCDFKEALHFLRNELESFSFHQPENISPNKMDKKQNYAITKIQTLQNTILIDYLRNRSLNISICERFLVEVYYQLNNKKYFGVGFKNHLGGIEIRNKYVKLCLGKKWYNWINNHRPILYVFESWSDFLAMLSLDGKLEKNGDFLILNSLAMLSKADEIFNNYIDVFLMLDNDLAGTNATEKCIVKHGRKMIDARGNYKKHKDINDFLISYTQS